jgi:pyridoxine kinase
VNILSIQSWVAYGHVGNASAAFPLQRLGAEVWAVNTVQFSNHTGYGAWTGSVFTGAQISELVDGIAARGVLPSCDAVLSGYMGSADIGSAIVAAARRVKQHNPRALYCCDPVIGDVDRGVFVRPGVPEFFAEQAIPIADIATPNQFELEYLTGMTVGNLADARHAAATLQARGPRVVLVTSLRTEETPEDAVDMLAADGDVVQLLRTPLLPLSINGAGDAIAALFLFHMLRTGDVGTALSEAGSAVWGLLARTAEAGSREILTVAAQDEFVAPTRRFAAQPLI